MLTPFLRLALFVLAWPAALVVGIMIYEWLQEEYPQPPEQRLYRGPVQYPLYQHLAVDALERLNRLPRAERQVLLRSLEAHLLPLPQWLEAINERGFRILCLGEYHRPETRRFLAEQIFPYLRMDALFLEATPDELRRIERRSAAGAAYFPLLDADIVGVLRSVRSANPGLRVQGVEETDRQRLDRSGREGSRDRTIADNVRQRFRKGERHVLLYGAEHCAERPGRLFHLLQRDAGSLRKDALANVHVIGEHQDGPLEAFVHFLQQLGMARETFVIHEAASVHPRIREWFGLLHQQIFAQFTTVIVFRGTDDPVSSTDGGV